MAQFARDARAHAAGSVAAASGAHVAVGVGDGLGEAMGFSALRTVGGVPVRWIGVNEAHVALDVPRDATHVGVEVWAPWELVGRRASLRLGVHDEFVNSHDVAARALDICFPLRAGRWQVLECPLRPYGLGSSTRVHFRLQFSPGGPAWLQRAVPPRLALRAAWVRGPRLRNADVTLVVLNWQRPDETIACLESLRAADLGGARVLVVDNGSRDDSVARLRARFPEQEILTLPENRGYAGGNNAGIAHALDAGARAVLLLNNDAVVAPDFLDPLIWILNSHLRVAAVSSATLRPDGQTLELAWLRVHFGHGLVRRVGMHALPSEGYNHPREVPVVVGCSVLIAGDALREIGALDADYFAYHEDVDWCFRAHAAGWEVHYQPLSRVYHAGSRSTAALVRPLGSPRNTGRPRLPGARELSWNPVRSYLGARNTIRFLERHARWWHWLYFIAATVYHMPLEAFAIAMDHEEEYLIGDWSYGIGLAYLLFGPRETRTPAVIARGLLTAPWRLLVTLPRAFLARHRDGRTAEQREHLRGLHDGLLHRPPDLHRLGLR